MRVARWRHYRMGVQLGKWERYNPRGKHNGVWSPNGEQIKNPVSGRTIEPIVKTVVITAILATVVYVTLKIIAAAATWECEGCGALAF